MVLYLQGETEPFKPYTHRYPVPYKASNSTAPFWYSIKRASAHIIVLASYSAYGKNRCIFVIFSKQNLIKAMFGTCGKKKKGRESRKSN